MSLLSLFTRKPPTLGYGELTVQFDAVLEQVVTKAAQITEFPVEFGANASDHRIVMPVRYTLVGAISNNPVRIGLDNIAGVAAQVATGAIGSRLGSAASAVSSAVGGAISAAFLAGSSGTRSSSAWDMLSDLLANGEPFDVQVGDELIQDMVIIRLDRRRTPQNEDGLEFIADLQQLQIINTQTVQKGTVKSADQLPANDPVSTQAAPVESRGQVVGLPE